MDAHKIVEQIRAFLSKVEDDPANSSRFVPAAQNLLRMAENANRDLNLAVEDLQKWIKDLSQTERTAS